jgi:hypothetical protein
VSEIGKSDHFVIGNLPRVTSLPGFQGDKQTTNALNCFFFALKTASNSRSCSSMGSQTMYRSISWSAEPRLTDLPVEMLCLIFSNFPNTYRHPEMQSRPPIFDCSDIFSIRSTCREFRNVCLGLPFWRDEKFTFTDIIPERRKWKTKDTFDEYDAGFLRLLFRDKPLVEAIGRRTHWHFKNLATLLTVIEFVPSFEFTSTHVALLFHSNSSNPWDDMQHPRHLHWRPSPVNEAIASLAVCRCLTSLEVQLDYYLRFRGEADSDIDLDLSLIAEKLPSITHLRIINPSRLIGSLAKLTNLESLLVDASWSKIDGNSVSLPFNSVKSLTHLSVLCDGHRFCCDVDCANRAFDEFVNLTSLFVHPLSNEMCDVLLRSKIKLNDFRTTVRTNRGHIYIEKVVRLIRASSLCSVKTLRMVFEHDYDWTEEDEFCPYYARLAEAITTDHYEIESLVLGIGIHTDWFTNFARLTSLKTLVWYVPNGYCRDESFDDSVATRDVVDPVLLRNMAVICKNKLDGVFRGFAEKPLIDLMVLSTIYDPLPLCTRYLCVTWCGRIPFLYDDGLYDPINPPWKAMDRHLLW